MEAAASLRQTVTHLFDAVRYSLHAKELEQAAVQTESSLQLELSKLESQTDEISDLLSGLKNEQSDALKQLSHQLQEFLSSAKEQAEERLRRSASEELDERRRGAASERDKALKSLEAFLATDPLPVIENLVQVRLNEGIYEARSRYECEGGMKYDFRLASQNSKLFHQELILSRLGYELRVPVRFSRALLKKARVPGFERLDQYVLTNAEASGAKLRANFHKEGNGATLKVITTGPNEGDFVGLEYSDRAEAVNVMNDPTLTAHVDLPSIRKATEEVVAELHELAKKKVALLKLSLNGEESLEDLDYEKILDLVLRVLGPSYKAVVQKLFKAGPGSENSEGVSLTLIKERLKLLGPRASKVSASLGIPIA
jgi:hypothetical protein